MFNTKYKYKHGIIIYYVNFKSLTDINDFIIRDREDLEYFTILFDSNAKATIKE